MLELSVCSCRSTDSSIDRGCSQYNAANLSNFNGNLNATFLYLKTQMSNQRKRFAKTQSVWGADSVYALFRCRSYLSIAECLACFKAATGANGIRVISYSYFLRYNPIFNPLLLHFLANK
ncbi:hypothetical protein L6164_030881 [Bauhinia variegata]|uniref:Uncharacterized protein n=1 Tax=Bauhinia variegata TaxID=167791 RepID=A0ACB9LF07_BAUVA|nr:hypothetical protein L6164_030881 [Bauhinia variegata]